MGADTPPHIQYHTPKSPNNLEGNETATPDKLPEENLMNHDVVPDVSRTIILSTAKEDRKIKIAKDKLVASVLEIEVSSTMVLVLISRL